MNDLVSYLGNFWNNIFVPLKEDYYRLQDIVYLLDKSLLQKNKIIKEKNSVIDVLIARHNEFEDITNKQEKELVKLRSVVKIYRQKKKEKRTDLTKTQSYTDTELLQLENVRLRKQNKALLEKIKKFEKKRLINK